MKPFFFHGKMDYDLEQAGGREGFLELGEDGNLMQADGNSFP